MVSVVTGLHFFVFFVDGEMPVQYPPPPCGTHAVGYVGLAPTKTPPVCHSYGFWAEVRG